jgi:hypothetical protein
VPHSAHLVLAAAKPWHYWISFVLVLSLVLMLLGLAAGYVWRVVLVKYGFRTEK